MNEPDGQQHGTPSRRTILRLGAGVLAVPLLDACVRHSPSKTAHTSPPSSGTTSSTPTSTASPSDHVAEVTFSPRADPINLDHTFAGLSFEKGTLSHTVFSADNRALVALFTRLGSGVLRVGGNSADVSSWQPTGPDLVGRVLTRKGVDRFAGFVRASGWHVIYALSFVNNSAQTMADEASYVAAALGDALIGFELCNEPDLYHQNGIRPDNYSEFRATWEEYATAVHAAAPSVALTGPATSHKYQTYTLPFAVDERARVSTLTQHYYGDPATASVASMLAPDPKLVTMLKALRDASGPRLPYRLTETNTYPGGGVRGISDTHAAALWVINRFFTFAEYGCSGANLHGGDAIYSPVRVRAQDGSVLEVGPEYYGLHLFRRAAVGSLLQTQVATSGRSISAHSVRHPDGSTSVVLVNTDSSQSYETHINCNADARTANLSTLSGHSLGSHGTTRLDGAPVTTAGAWSPASQRPMTVQNARLTVAVPPASAVLVQIT